MVEFNSDQMFWLAVSGLILLGMMWNELMKTLRVRAGGVLEKDKPLINIEVETQPENGAGVRRK